MQIYLNLSETLPNLYAYPEFTGTLRELQFKRANPTRIDVNVSNPPPLASKIVIAIKRRGSFDGDLVAFAEAPYGADHAELDLMPASIAIDEDLGVGAAKDIAEARYIGEIVIEHVDGKIATRTFDVVIHNDLVHLGDPSAIPPYPVYPPPDSLVSWADVGHPNGVAPLSSDGRVPANNLPSYVDDVIEYNALSNFPRSGEQGKLYVDLGTNKLYRWSGTTYISITSAPLTVVDNLSSSSRTDALSANMGNILNSSISWVKDNYLRKDGSFSTVYPIEIYSSPIIFYPYGSGDAVGIVNHNGVLGTMPCPNSDFDTSFANFSPLGGGGGGSSLDIENNKIGYNDILIAGEPQLSVGVYQINLTFYFDNGQRKYCLPVAGYEDQINVLRPFNLSSNVNVYSHVTSVIDFPDESGKFVRGYPLTFSVRDLEDNNARYIINPGDYIDYICKGNKDPFTGYSYINISLIVNSRSNEPLFAYGWVDRASMCGSLYINCSITKWR